MGYNSIHPPYPPLNKHTPGNLQASDKSTSSGFSARVAPQISYPHFTGNRSIRRAFQHGIEHTLSTTCQICILAGQLRLPLGVCKSCAESRNRVLPEQSPCFTSMGRGEEENLPPRIPPSRQLRIHQSPLQTASASITLGIENDMVACR